MSLASVLQPIYKRQYALSLGDIADAQQAIERLESSEPETVIRTLWSALHAYVEGVHDREQEDARRDLESDLQSAEDAIDDLESTVDSLEHENDELRAEMEKMEKELEGLRGTPPPNETT